MKGASKYYRRIKELKEEFIGTPEEQYTVILNDPWVWDNGTDTKTFDSIAKYMRDIRFTEKKVLQPEETCLETGTKKHWEESLGELSSIGK